MITPENSLPNVDHDEHQGEPVTPQEVVPWINGKGGTNNIGHLHDESGLSVPFVGPLPDELARDLTPPPSRARKDAQTSVLEVVNLPRTTEDKPILTAEERRQADLAVQAFLQPAIAEQTLPQTNLGEPSITQQKRPSLGRRLYNHLPFTRHHQEQLDPKFGPAD